LQPLEAALAGGDCAAARRIVRQHLADDEDLVPVAADRVGDDRLGFAVAVHLGGIDEADAARDAVAQRLHLVGPGPSALAHAPGAEAVDRHRSAGRQTDSGDRARGHERTTCAGPPAFHAYGTTRWSSGPRPGPSCARPRSR